MIGEWQKLHLTLHGNLCSTDFEVGSYHSLAILSASVPYVLVHLYQSENHLQVVMPIGKVDIILMEDRSPLKRCRMLSLTSRAMTKLRIQRLLSRKLIFDLPTMAASLISDMKSLALLIIVVMDLIWRCLLPLFHSILVRLAFLARWLFVSAHRYRERADECGLPNCRRSSHDARKGRIETKNSGVHGKRPNLRKRKAREGLQE